MTKKIIRTILLIAFDIAAVIISWMASMILLGLNFATVYPATRYYRIGAIFVILFFNAISGLYSSLFKYMGINEAVKILFTGAMCFIYLFVVALVDKTLIMGWAILLSLLIIAEIGVVRFWPRIMSFFKEAQERIIKRKKYQNVLIIGAGAAAHALIQDLRKHDELALRPVCILDDDRAKIGRKLDGVKIFDEIAKVGYAVRRFRIEKIIIAIPSLDKKTMNNIVSMCKMTKCNVLSLPNASELVNCSVSIKDAKPINILDLLGREQVKVNIDDIIGYIENKVVLVTGGGGSIGSELCRQIASHSPKQLIILDVYENNAYEIEQELKRKLPNLNLLTLIASVRDLGKIEDVFKKYRPNIVFHAAAHKHVPLMETSPNEAVKNNVCGTHNVADVAGRFGAEKFVLISTDKAVNPTNIMGASKRICEMIVQTINKKYKTDYVAVRFGNVLGSNGSVVPLFTKQIADGGPITVTHKDIVRYFMTIPEAVSLVLQAGAFAKGGEIFVLNMGEPVKIYDLAVNMIKLSGLEPFKDIDIKITGLRPGEKLYEEMLMSEEGLAKTENEMIYIGRPLDIDEHTLFDRINEMKDLAYQETESMKEVVHELVPTYKIDRR